MPFSNLDYLYRHLPARVRRDDDALFLKRFLSFFGEQLDGWDATYDNFYQQINPQTASEEFVHWWLWSLFGWSWFPAWFSLSRKRHLYAEFATHLARRGTWFGIEAWLREFSIFARVYSHPEYWGEFVWGEGWTITEPLGVVVQIDHLADEVNFDRSGQGWGEWAWGEGYFADTKPTLTKKEIEDLVRFEWPNGQRVMVEYRVRRDVSHVSALNSDQPIFNADIVPDENSAPLVGLGVN